MSAVDDVFDFLEYNGIANGSTGWTLVRRRMLETPAEDQLVMVSEDGGGGPEIPAEAGTLGDAAMYDIGVLVIVRAARWDGDASATKAQEIFDALHGQRFVTVGSTEYLRVRARTPEPIFVGFDDNGKPRHTISFMLLRDAVVSA